MYSVLMPVLVTAVVVLAFSLVGLAAFAVAAVVWAARGRFLRARDAQRTPGRTARGRSRR